MQAVDSCSMDTLGFDPHAQKWRAMVDDVRNEVAPPTDIGKVLYH